MFVLVEMYGIPYISTSTNVWYVFVLVEMYGISECPNGTVWYTIHFYCHTIHIHRTKMYGIVCVLMEMYGMCVCPRKCMV